jgi:benzoate-CoA ligase
LITLPENFNVATWFVDRNVQEDRGAKVAIECGDERVTYQQLLENTNRAGNALLDVGVRPEERVLLLLLDTPDFLYCFFGAIKIGAVAVPVNTLAKPRDYEYMLNDSRARTVIVSEPLLPHLESLAGEKLHYLRQIVVASDFMQGLSLQHPSVRTAGLENAPRNDSTAPFPVRSLKSLMGSASPQLEPARTSKDEPAFWLYSSGSTGSSKGCVHLHHDMVGCTERYAKGILRMNESDRCFSVARLFFAYGLGNAGYFPLGCGATTILDPVRPTPTSIYADIERYKPTLFFSVPSNYASLLSYHREQGPDFDLSTVRHAVSAGEALPAPLFHRFKERFGVEILDAIGSTEALHMFIANRPGAVRPGSSGQVLPGYEARIVDENGHDVPGDEPGNLLIRGDAVCSCYWNQHEKTKETIQGHWLRTGDKYYRDADGYYWYVGRSDDMMKVKGMWVSPVEVESVLLEHPQVQEAAVVGWGDGNQLVKPAAYVVLKPGENPSDELGEGIRRHLASRLAAHKCPQWLEFVRELPKTATGKIQRYKLRQSAASHKL